MGSIDSKVAIDDTTQILFNALCKRNAKKRLFSLITSQKSSTQRQEWE